MGTLMETGLGKRKLRRDGEGIDPNLLTGVPIFLRDLLARLPPHVGPPPDIDTFLEHLKKTVLPPRPSTEERDETVVGQSTAFNPLANQHKSTSEDDVILLSGSKRKGNYEDEEEDEEDSGIKREDENRDDIFKQRCRFRMSME